MIFLIQILLLLAWYLVPAFAHVPWWLIFAPVELGAIIWIFVFFAAIALAAAK